MSKLPILITLIFSLALAGCDSGGSKSAKGILSEKKMVDLLVDTHLVDAILYVDNARSDDKRDKGLFYYPSVLEKHGVTKAQMDSSVAWYMRNPKAFARVYDKVMKKLETRQELVKKNKIPEE